MRLSDALRAMHEFFHLHSGGAQLDAELCVYFRDGLADAVDKATEIEETIEECMGALGADEPPASYDYDRALEHQSNRDLVRHQRVRLDDKVVAFPNAFREEAFARLAVAEHG